MDNPKKIACFHMNQVGDLLFSLPAIYNLRQKYPDAQITSIVRNGCDGLISRTGLVDKILVRPRSTSDMYLRFVPKLRHERFDLILLFSTSEEAWIVSQISNIRVKAGFNHCMRGFLLDIKAPWMSPPSTQNNLKLIKSLGCPVIKTDYTGLIQPNEEDQLKADCLLKDYQLLDGYIVISPGTSTGREVKRWSDNKFAEAADLLYDKYKLKSVVVGLTGGDQITSQSQNVIDMTGKTSLPVLCSILKKAKLFIGVDSGVMHLAASMGTPVAALFGPTDESVTGPQGSGNKIIHAAIDCRPCMKKDCTIGRRCMEEIAVNMLIDSICSMNFNAEA